MTKTTDPETDWPAAIRALLAATGWSQGRLAAEVRCHPNAVGFWVRGRRTPTGLYRDALAERLLAVGIDPPR